MLGTVFDFADCSIDISLFVLYCVCFVGVLCVLFLTGFMSDCCMTEFVDLRNNLYVYVRIYYVCMYACVHLCMYVFVYVCMYVCMYA